jgi:ribonuclease HI
MHVYTDGASRGNPGPASYAFVAVENGEIVYDESGYLGEQTNNHAEYQAVINALDRMISHDNLHIHSDSKLIVNQLNGVWNVKSDNIRPLYKHAMHLLANYETVTFTHHTRDNHYVAAADQRCNNELDNHI